VTRLKRWRRPPLVEDPRRLEGVASIGVDETAYLAANRSHHSEFITGIVALPGPGRASAQLLDIMPGRTRAAVQQWTSARPLQWRDQVTTCSLDPFRGYTTALSAACRTRPGSWTPSTSYASGRLQSTTPDAASSSRPSVPH